MQTLLIALMLPALAIPVVYGLGKKSAKIAALVLTLISLVSLSLLLTLIPTVLNSGHYAEEYYWIPTLNSAFTLYVDGISLSLAIATMILVAASIFYSINYMDHKKSLPEYYALMSFSQSVCLESSSHPICCSSTSVGNSCLFPRSSS